jgi:hypothetical protein
VSSSDWVDSITALYDGIYRLAVFIYPVTWAIKIFKKIGIRG